MTKSDPRNIKVSTKQRLYALSGNQCAFPYCQVKFLNSEDETNISAICHIEAAEAGGQRYNPESNDDYRRSFANLILLCPNHHKETDNVAKYTVSRLQEMKKNHEVKIEKLVSPSDTLSKYPSALNTIISFIGERIFNDINTKEPQNAPDPEEKIQYNNILRYRYIIEEYRVYQAKLNQLYKEIETQGSSKKEVLLTNIKTIYLVEKGKYKDIIEIRGNADDIIDNVKNKLWETIENSPNKISDSLSKEAIEVSLLIILVDAFMRCNILEEPLKGDK